MEVLQSNKGKVCILFILVLLILFGIKGCQDKTVKEGKVISAKEYKITISNLVQADRKSQEDWGNLLADIAFEDVCNEIYITRLNELGQEFIDNYQTFINLKVKGDKEVILLHYEQYSTYFTLYKEIGTKLQEFSKLIKEGNYQEAITNNEEIKGLLKTIPIIE